METIKEENENNGQDSSHDTSVEKKPKTKRGWGALNIFSKLGKKDKKNKVKPDSLTTLQPQQHHHYLPSS